jgi:probable LLM family oxidoreductase
MEFGISTFGEVDIEHISGKAVKSAYRMSELVAEAKLADASGLDVFAAGEHHRPDFIVSSPEVVLGGLATVTNNIRLSSSVTVLSSTDPVRTFQNFATVDLLSGGRAEIIAGRGSFIESFPLFGYNLNDYDELFIEKLQLLMAINQQEVVNWKGRHRASLSNMGVYPRPLQPFIPIWIGMGGTPNSAIRAGKLGLPLTLAILGGAPSQFAKLVQLYRQSATQAGHDTSKQQVAINLHIHLAEDSQQASDELWPTYSQLMHRIGQERGWSPMTRQQFEYLRSPEGPLCVGTPEEVAEKIIYLHQLFGNTRFLGQIVKGVMPHDRLLNSIELLGKKVKPMVEEAFMDKVQLV